MLGHVWGRMLLGVSELLLTMLDILEGFLLEGVNIVNLGWVVRHLSFPAQKLGGTVVELRTIAFSLHEALS